MGTVTAPSYLTGIEPQSNDWRKYEINGVINLASTCTCTVHANKSVGTVNNHVPTSFASTVLDKKIKNKKATKLAHVVHATCLAIPEQDKTAHSSSALVF